MEKLRKEFEQRLTAAKRLVSAERSGGNKLGLANALKELGNIERRPPHLRDDSNRTFAEAAALYRELELPLEAGWVLRHIGINHEYAGLLTDAEKYYDESLELFRIHADKDDANYANMVRYPAVVKNRLGKRRESAELWEEAVRRYDDVNLHAGVAEGAAWLAIFANESGDSGLANEWFAKAGAAAEKARDSDTDKWISEVKKRLKTNHND